jgi:hypothetical protein
MPERKVKKVSELPEVCRKCPQRKIDRRVICIHNEELRYIPCYFFTTNSGRILKHVSGGVT